MKTSWSVLKKNKCPLCGSGLHSVRVRRVSICKNKECTFRIGDEKLSRIIGGVTYVSGSTKIISKIKI